MPFANSLIRAAYLEVLRKRSLLLFQARQIDYFQLREKRKEEYNKYYENSIIIKGAKDASQLEYPTRGDA